VGGARSSLIDPTPARIGAATYLTYKTQYRRADHLWHTTTRLVRLDPADPSRTVANRVHANGASVRITNSVNKYIEENPVLVARGGRFTLFTSFGWYGTCHYFTRFRQSTNPWTGWPAKAHVLAMPKGTCGTGNAQVVAAGRGWRIFFNGHRDGKPHHPFMLYVGKVTWSGGTPEVPARL
jgi:hypothetical protein